MASHYTEASRDKESSVNGLETSQTSEIPNSGLISATAQITIPSVLDELPDNQQKILAFLKELKEERENNGSQYASEVFTDRVSAVNEIISPKIITDILYAKKIKADSIEGLEILTDKISSLQGQVTGLVTQSDASASAEFITTPTAFPIRNIEFESGKFTGGLIIQGPSEFKGESIFEKLTTFLSNVIFKGKVTFEEVPTFNKDTAGFAVIEKDADTVDITFEKEYETTPIVSANFSFGEFKKEDGTADDQSMRQKKLFEQGHTFMVVNRTKKGFTIVLNKKATEDIAFSWVALAVKDAKTSVGKKPVQTEIPTPVLSSTPTPSASPSLTIEANITPSQEASPSAQ